MSRLKISQTGNCFIKDGKPFFLLSDTDWMAFQKLTVKEFEELVIHRKQQGFTALQISVMPVAHDNAASERDVFPFELVDGKYNPDKINTAYFDRAVEMLKVMQKHGLIPFLHLLWVNHIPDTWASKRNPNTVLPFKSIRPLITYFTERFEPFEPIYSVSGDTNFDTEQEVKYYLEVLDVLSECAPEALTTMHQGFSENMPEVLCQHPKLDFFAYQSGHSAGDDLFKMLKLSDIYVNMPYNKLVVNTEPCYEGHGHAGRYGRFGAYDIRRAVWLSILSGASAGVTYGAHGVWQFFTDGDVFGSCEFSSQPYEWRAAINLPGAWDVGYAKWIYERYNMFGLKPSGDIEARGDIVRMAEKDGLVVVYAPYQDEFKLLRDLSGYRVEAIALDTRRVTVPNYEIKDGTTHFKMSKLNEDMLVIATKL